MDADEVGPFLKNELNELPVNEVMEKEKGFILNFNRRTCLRMH